MDETRFDTEQVFTPCAGYMEYPFKIKHKKCGFKYSSEVDFLSDVDLV